MRPMVRTSGRNAEKTLDPEVIAKALATAMCQGDFVNFCSLFHPASPAREDSPERFDTPKYACLLPDEALEGQPDFEACLARVKRPETQAHIHTELRAKRPPRMPADLLLVLADNALRRGKYTSAAQAYELLRIRGRMQEEFLRQADEAFELDDVPKAVTGYVLATGLAYDYAAFPEPLPAVADFQRHALMLHGDYPRTPEECIGMQDTGPFLRAAFAYLLLDAAMAARLEKRDETARVAFLVELVYRRDPDWDTFAARYREAAAMAREFREVLSREEGAEGSPPDTLAAEIAQQMGADADRVMAHLLGRRIKEGEWWQYLKEIAYEHPPAALFIAREAMGEREILAPRARNDSPVVKALGLTGDAHAA